MKSRSPSSKTPAKSPSSPSTATSRTFIPKPIPRRPPPTPSVASAAFPRYIPPIHQKEHPNAQKLPQRRTRRLSIHGQSPLQRLAPGPALLRPPVGPHHAHPLRPLARASPENRQNLGLEKRHHQLQRSS